MINNHTITKTDAYKYLGVTIDQHLKWNKHISLTATRIRKTIYKFRRLRHILDLDILRQTYHAIVQSIAEYGLLAWGGAFPSHLHPLEVALRSVLRVAMCKPRRYPSSQLLTDFHVLSLTQLYTRQLLLYRFERDLSTDGQADYILHGRNTRLAAGRNLRTIAPKTTLYKTSHMYNSISAYNSLPETFKQTTNIKKFSSKIKHYIFSQPAESQV